MKKRINTDAITNELKGGSAFFPGYINEQQSEPQRTEEPERKPVLTAPKKESIKKDSSNASKKAIMLASYQDDMIELVRKAVKTPGKEVSFVRLTPDEKNKLSDIVYTYKRDGVKTSENEINRIAINYLIEDYQINGQESLLAKVLAALNA